MKLSTPEEVSTEESASDKSAEAEKRSEVRTVSVGGEEMSEREAIELFGQMLFEPESFGLALESGVEQLRDRVDQLEEQNERLREDLDDAEAFIEMLSSTLGKARSLEQVQFKDRSEL